VLVLALDTSLDACSAAFTRDGEVLGSRVEIMARGQAERLAPMVRDLALEAGVSFPQIDRIGVTRGPGAFTGVRIGLSFARGLALALGRPCVGLSTLEALALGAAQTRIVSVIEVAGSLFVGAWDGRTNVIAAKRTNIEDVLGTLKGDWSVTGPGAATILAHRPDWIEIAQARVDPIVLAHAMAQADPNLSPPDPLYLRGVEAKLAGGVLPTAPLL
jgi:tRNA threonylcarbamoyladenosine biosynthesis protein TsaB